MRCHRALDKPSFPGRIFVRQVVDAARASGLEVAGVEITHSGSVRTFGPGAFAAGPADEFERLEAEGKL